MASSRSAPPLTAVIPRLDRYGGQERSTLEVLVRLARRGWRIRLYARSLSDWPEDAPIDFRPVRVAWLRAQLLINIAFAGSVAVRRALDPEERRRVSITIGAAAFAADVRVVQYLNITYRALTRARRAPLPNAPTALRRLYQEIYALWESCAERYALPRTRVVIAISERIRDEVRAALAGAAMAIRVIPHAPDERPGAGGELPEAARAALAGMDREATPIVLFVGALERKGIAKALEYLAGVADLPWRFWAVGGGDVAGWQRRADELGIGARTTFFGATRALPFFGAADLFLLPSLYEPFGLVVAEAVSHGLTPVCSSECGAMELWPARPPWLALSAGDADARWSDALRRLLSAPEERAQLGAAARSAFCSWSWDKATDAYEDVLRSCQP